MATDSYSDGDRVFVKMKGYPTWPALVKDRIPGKVESYNVFFYGSYDSAKVKPDSMHPYNEETKAKFGKALKKGGAKFHKAMEEIENNFEVSPEAEPEPEEPELVPLDEPVGDDGELVIDEPPVQPPVLKKEGKAANVSTGKKVATKKELKVGLPPTPEVAPVDEPVATPKPRRGSKAGKKDMNLTNPATPEPVTPLPQAEVVSRSGRKIKPKRFADEEVQFSTPAGAKSSQATEDGKSNEVSPAKRTKRTGSVGSKAPVTPLPAVKAEPKALPPPPPLERPKLVGKRANQRRKTSTEASGTGSADVPSVTTLPPPPLRAMPSLAAAPPSPTVIPREPEAVKSHGTAEKASVESDAPGEKGKSENLSEVNEEETVVKEDGLDISAKDEGGDGEDSSSPPTPDGQSKDAHETDDEGTGKENNSQEEEPLDNYENGMGEDSDEGQRNVPKKMRVELKNGAASTVLSFNHERPTYFRNEAASVEYDMATARSVLQTKTQLEVNETAFLKTIADSLPVSTDEKEVHAREKAAEVQKKVAQLRMEGETLEIVGELVGSLGVKFANCDRAMDLLDKLASRTDINILALKKNPEVVEVIRKVQNYHGNAHNWKNLNQAQLDDFHVKAEIIRDKAINIYQTFKLLFCTTSEAPFSSTFNAEVGKFNHAVALAGFSGKAAIGLYEEPTQPLLETSAPDGSDEPEVEPEETVDDSTNATVDDDSMNATVDDDAMNAMVDDDPTDATVNDPPNGMGEDEEEDEYYPEFRISISSVDDLP